MAKYYKIKDSTSHREVEGQILLVSQIDDELYTLNGMGKLVWMHLMNGLSTDEIASQIANAYSIEIGQAQADVAHFIEMLEAHEFIVADE